MGLPNLPCCLLGMWLQTFCGSSTIFVSGLNLTCETVGRAWSGRVLERASALDLRGVGRAVAGARLLVIGPGLRLQVEAARPVANKDSIEHLRRGGGQWP